MGKDSSIEWTDHTFNPWWGCSKVSPGCNNCYAETWAKRVGLKIWGEQGTRRFFTEKHWREPLIWNEDARKQKRRKRVFCASMADVFEARDELDAWRNHLWDLISRTQWLDWLLLTKRPQNIQRMVPKWITWPSNIWLGTTVEDQIRAWERLPLLLTIPARIRFLSCEPMLGPLNLKPWIEKLAAPNLYSIDWVIAGGESGPHARPMLPSWARSLRDQCRTANIPFHFKQWGHWVPASRTKLSSTMKTFWDGVSGQEVLMEARGKKKAGRKLDRSLWNGFPKAA